MAASSSLLLLPPLAACWPALAASISGVAVRATAWHFCSWLVSCPATIAGAGLAARRHMETSCSTYTCSAAGQHELPAKPKKLLGMARHGTACTHALTCAYTHAHAHAHTHQAAPAAHLLQAAALRLQRVAALLQLRHRAVPLRRLFECAAIVRQIAAGLLHQVRGSRSHAAGVNSWPGWCQRTLRGRMQPQPPGHGLA